MTTNNIIVYDLETQKTFAEVGGQNQQAKLLVSFVGLYSYSQDKYFSFFEQDLPKLEKILQVTKPTIVGFNSISFDNRVIQPYFQSLNISQLPQVDILAEIYQKLGYRMKLESVAQATLHEGKSGSGLDAIRYYREGDLVSLEKYCLDDVRITKDVFEYGRQHGFILYTSSGLTHRLPVSWANEITISQQLQQAYQQHLRVKIDYMQFEPAPKTIQHAEVDILTLTPSSIETFCHTTNTKQVYAVEHLIKVELLDTNSAYQAKLF